MEVSNNHFKKMKYFIEKVFPGNKAVWNEFGYEQHRKAYKSHHRMIRFMNELDANTQKYSKQLLAVNMSQDKIVAVKPLHDNLE